LQELQKLQELDAEECYWLCRNHKNPRI